MSSVAAAPDSLAFQVNATRAPSRAATTQIARPIPLEPPVTSTRWPARRPVSAGPDIPIHGAIGAGAANHDLSDGSACRATRCDDGSGDGLGLAVAYQAQRRSIVAPPARDRKSTRLNSSHLVISYAV